jgi:hypothetical protein
MTPAEHIDKAREQIAIAANPLHEPELRSELLASAQANATLAIALLLRELLKAHKP